MSVEEMDPVRLRPDSTRTRLAREQAADDLGIRYVALSELEFNRTGRAIEGDDEWLDPYEDARERYSRGFAFDDADNSSKIWYPQGLTGSFDASGDEGAPEGEFVLITSYDTEGETPEPWVANVSPCARRGLRLTVVRISGFPNIEYRHMLLVEAYTDGTTGAANFRAMEKTVVDGVENFEERPHGGGCVWIGPYLYVTDENRLLVFDMRRVMDLGTTGDEDGCADVSVGVIDGVPYAFGFRYVAPLVMTYEVPSDEALLVRHFHTLGVDRPISGFSSPPRLVSAKFVVPELMAGVTGFDGGLETSLACFWDFDPATGLLTESGGEVVSSTALRLNQHCVQGIMGRYPELWICESGIALRIRDWVIEAASNRLLYISAQNAWAGALADWPILAEGLYLDLDLAELWNITEENGRRLCFSVDFEAWFPTAGPSYVFDLYSALTATPYLSVYRDPEYRFDPYEHAKVLDDPPFPKEDEEMAVIYEALDFLTVYATEGSEIPESVTKLLGRMVKYRNREVYRGYGP